jgi:hypothetical protein
MLQEDSFHHQSGLTFKEKNYYSDAAFGTELCRVLELGNFGKQIRNTWKFLRRGAGER